MYYWFNINVSFQITFQKIGLGATTGFVEGLGPVMTLKDTVDYMGDSGKVISYLKVDIEGSGMKFT